MTMVIINPGTGPVEGSTLEHAYRNMEALLRDAGCPAAKWRRDPARDVEGGRWPFLVTCPPNAEEPREWDCLVDMPGIPLDEVRYVGGPGQNIWDFPRLYVDGSSWVWKFAVSQLREKASPPNGEASKGNAK